MSFDISGFIPTSTPDSKGPPKKVPAQLSSIQPPKTVTARVSELADKEGMKKDDPLRLIHIEHAKAQDRFDKMLASHGPEAGKLAAEAAARVMRQLGDRFLRHMKARTVVLAMLGGGALFGGGMGAGWILRGATPVEVAGASLPFGMAEIFTRQDWPAQWEARKRLPVKSDGAAWSLVPVLEKYSKPY